jgi:hypothetical protein
MGHTNVYTFSARSGIRLVEAVTGAAYPGFSLVPSERSADLSWCPNALGTGRAVGS